MHDDRNTTAFLLRVGELLASDADERAILRSLAHAAVPGLADCCTVHLLRGDGTVENVAVAGAEASRREVARFSRLAPDAPLRVCGVQLHARITDEVAIDRADADFLQRLGIRSLIVAPIVIRGTAAGAIRFMSTAPEPYRADDARVAEDVARRAALAIDNARSRAEAAASAHSRDLFLAMLSHEMKTSLTSILGWTRLLRSDGPSSDLFGEALEAIEHSATVQQRLIEDLLDVSRIITGKLHLEFAPVDVEKLLVSTVETLEPRAKESGQHIRLTEAAPASVYGDETRLRQVLWNLLTNAMKYTPSGGLIELAATAAEDGVTISVRDTGCGIRAEVLPHVFDRFHQATIADRAKHGGLGLGLAIVRNIVELHGGHVEAASAGEGKGATFFIRLPAHRGVTALQGGNS
ncbi:MAG TPA: GAF domain-containing sensor histidine kinase [Thermoanaerobaculia bacterium]|nr:GAF domain-containing sensor histidine kinase [Thermoanaerobaculia bacterium]